MRKWIALVMTVLAGSISYANAAMGEFDIEAGYRRDTIDWRYRFPSSEPVSKTSLQFKDLDIFQIGLDARTTIGCNFYVRGNAYWGWILDGDFKNDTDAYFSTSGSYSEEDFYGFSGKYKSTVSDQYVFGVNAAIGYPFFFCDCTMVLAPVVGYSFDEQNCRTDNKDTNFGSNYYSDYSSSGCCCEQTFISRWYGPFVGLDFEWRPWNSCLNLWANAEYHWGDFRGKRSHIDCDCCGNRHSDNATAWVFGLGADYEMCNCWTLGLSLKFQDWSATHHFWSSDYSGYDSSSSGYDRARENNKWKSYAINVTLGREF